MKTTTIGFYALIALIMAGTGPFETISTCKAQSSCEAQSPWDKIGDLPGARKGHLKSVLDGKVYFMGGIEGPELESEALYRVDMYDPISGSWTPKAPMITNRIHFSTCIYDGKIFVIGGSKNKFYTPVNTIEAYDPATDNWTHITNLPQPAVGNAASLVDDKIYVFGGGTYSESDTVYKEAYVYDLLTDTWDMIADLPTPRIHPFSVEVGGKIYAMGGSLGEGDNHVIGAIVEMYDPATDTWTEKAEMITPRKYHQACEMNGKIYLFGGGVAWYTLTNVVLVYNPEFDTWKKVTPTPRILGAAGVVPWNGKFFISGGNRIEGSTPINDLSMYFYDPYKDPLQPRTVMPLRAIGRTCLKASDTLMMDVDSAGMVYIIPDTTPVIRDSIIKYMVLSIEADTGDLISIPLTDFDLGSFLVSVINAEGKMSDYPLRFCVVPFIPEITIRVRDYISGVPIADCKLDIGGSIYITDEAGEASFEGCGEYNEYSIEAGCEYYSSVDTTLVVFSDTTFTISLVRDSYLKVVDRVSKESVRRALVKVGSNTMTTDDDGVVTIQNLKSEKLIFSVEHNDYFIIEDSAALKSGDTLVVKLTKLQARIEFQVMDEIGPVANQTIEVAGISITTDDNGKTFPFKQEARNVYHYSIMKPCYYPIFDSFFLEIDTLLLIILEPDTILPAVDIVTSGDTLQISSSASGELYVVPPGTERQIDSIQANSFLTVPISKDDTLDMNTTDLPNGEYWIYIVDLCDKISTEMVFGVGVGNEEIPVNRIRIYPNPADKILIIELYDYGEYDIKVTSLNGQSLIIEKIEGAAYQLDLSSLQKGVYLITIRSKDFVTTRKIIKM